MRPPNEDYFTFLKCLVSRSDTVFGFFLLRVAAGKRRFRRWGYRYKIEQEAIERWLDMIKRAAATDSALACEIVACARLIKGYGDTYTRGANNFEKIAQQIIEPAIATNLDAKANASSDVAKARKAALADPEGKVLAQTLFDIAGTAGGVLPKTELAPE